MIIASATADIEQDDPVTTTFTPHDSLSLTTTDEEQEAPPAARVPQPRR